MTLDIPIIPHKQTFHNTHTKQIIPWGISPSYNLDLPALATFISMGFMLDKDTYFEQINTCNPGTKYQVNKHNFLEKKLDVWNWHYSPLERSFKDTLDEFSSLFKRLINEATQNKNVLLPISGGLDSRTLFVPVKKQSNLILCSYEFEGGFNEISCGRELSEKFVIPFYSQKIPQGYLWEKLEQIADLNGCLTDFTHPRQMVVLDNWKGLGNTILLGHWGDVLFDKHADSEDISYDNQLIQLKKKILKPEGVVLAEVLWKYWGLTGSFETYITDRLDQIYSKIDIDHPSARMRAFKSLYWAPKWTSINSSIFSQLGELVIPYYNSEMCKFICSVPERYLKGRKIQIEYIKQHCPEAAQIPWQKYYPFNLYNYKKFNSPFYFPNRVGRKMKNIIKKTMNKTPDLITRNWELQFLGKSSFLHLKKNLKTQNKLNNIVPKKVVADYLKKFQLEPVKYSHPISILLTLAVFADRYYQE